MSCPCHVQIFKQGLKSYRDLPLRLAEFGCCHRNEVSGALHGLLRVRSMTQDDAHIFCTDEQLQEESAKFIELLFNVYADFGFKDVMVRLATRPTDRIGDDVTWDRAEHALETALNNKGIQWQLAPGEGAFYGPKLEFHLKDCIGRVWQCGTLQVDYSQPDRLDANYIAEDGTKKRPVMLHRAIYGSLERFIAIILENYAGDLPVWLSPVQVVVMNITDRHADYATKLSQKLLKMGYRAKTDLRNEKIGFKIRDYTLKKVPLFLIVGDRELETESVTVRTRTGKDLGSMSFQSFVENYLQKLIQDKRSIMEE
jgi:threonyl-tRNA synthetase